jgi:hypothetical protein
MDRMLSNDDVLVEAVAHDLADLIAEQCPGYGPLHWHDPAMSDEFRDSMRRASRSVLSSIQSHLNERFARNEKGLCLTYWHGDEHVADVAEVDPDDAP